MATKKTTKKTTDPAEERAAAADKASREAAKEATAAAKDNPTADAYKASASDKEAPEGKGSGKGGDDKVRLATPVSQTDQSYLGAKSIDDLDLEDAHGFNATNTGAANVRRDNSEYAGNSAPRTWEQVYRENATDVDIRAGAKPKIEKPKE